MTGTTVVHYRIGEAIGAGGMGVVYRATDTRLGRDVAIKFLPQEFIDPAARDRFLREARAASVLNHPGICTVYDVGEDAGRPFLVMELLEGQTLRQRIAAGPLSVDEILDYGQQIADALAAAHSRNIIHRDIKSSNVFLTREGKTKILDFGLAKMTPAPAQAVAASEETESFHDLTVAGTTLGTAAYMSPEQARGEAVDARSDLFSFGVTLYEMETGQLPFQGPSNPAIFAALLGNEPAHPSALRPSLPAELEAVALKALQKDKELRYQSASDMRADLKRIAKSSQGSMATASMQVAASKRFNWSYATAAVALIAAGGAGFWAFRHFQHPPLTDKDIIVLADVRNNTGDPVFDTAVKEALTVQLEQSPFLRILRGDQARATLKFMEKPPDTKLTPEVAREVCIREGLKAVVQGSISSLGNRYLLRLEAVNCATGDSLAEEAAEAQGKDRVLEAVSAAVTRMRRSLGESMASIQRLNARADQATTASLEAFQSFALGEEERDKGAFMAAIPAYQRATEIDPEFALAYARLGVMYFNMGEMESCRAALEKAMQHIGRVSARERYYIQAHYSDKVTGETEKVQEAWEAQARMYPRDRTPFINLANVYMKLGQTDKAIETTRAALRIDPGNATAEGNLCFGLLRANRFQEARDESRKALVATSRSVNVYATLWQVSYYLNDQAEMHHVEKLVAGQPEEYRIVSLKWSLATALGQFRRAGELQNEIITLLTRSNLPQNMAGQYLAVGQVEALRNNCTASRDAVQRAITLVPDLEVDSGYTRAWCGDDAGARKAIEAMRKRSPKGTFENQISIPNVQAVMEWRHKRPELAVEALKPSIPYEAATIGSWQIRGLAYLDMKRGAEAAAEAQKLIDARGGYGLWLGRSLAYVWGARAYALAGDKEKARKLYSDFLTLWKDADPDQPIVTEAKRELAALN